MTDNVATEPHDGGCLCGKSRFRVEGRPVRVGICHCRYCQLRTGSAFSVSVYFARERVTRLSGTMQHFSQVSQSGNVRDIERCAECGTSIYWTIAGDAWEGLLGIAGGCFDPPTFWFDVTRELFTRNRAGFCTIEAPVQHATHPAYRPLRPDAGRLDSGYQ